MSILEKCNDGGYIFYCPGCKGYHRYGPGWKFNGDLTNPTFRPSLFVGKNCPKTPTCHLHVTNGKIEYCAACDHELSGQTVDMVDVDDT